MSEKICVVCGQDPGIVRPVICCKCVPKRKADPNHIGHTHVGTIPPEAGKVVDTCFFQDRYYVACEYAVFVCHEDKMVPIQFVDSLPKEDK